MIQVMIADIRKAEPHFIQPPTWSSVSAFINNFMLCICSNSCNALRVCDQINYNIFSVTVENSSTLSPVKKITPHKYNAKEGKSTAVQYLFYFILSFRNHSIIAIIWHEMYSLKLNVRRCRWVSLAEPLQILCFKITRYDHLTAKQKTINLN